MSIKSTYKQIVENLIDSTQSDDLKWTETYSTKDHKSFESAGNDGTVFKITISYSLNFDKWRKNTPYLKLLLKSGEDIIIHVSDISEIKQLNDLVFKKYCPTFIPTEKDVEDKLIGVSKGILSKTENRDRKIKTIFGIKF